MKIRVLRHVIFLSFFSIFLMGCKNEFPSGHFEGNLLEKQNDRYFFKPVHLDVSYINKKELYILITNEFQMVLSSIAISKNKKNEMQITISGMHNGKYLLHRVAEKKGFEKKQCYQGNSRSIIDLCFNKEQFLFKIVNQEKIPIFTLSGNRFQKDSPLPFESPKAVLLSDAIEEAFAKNFESQITIEHVIQARGAALSTWLNLIPHLNLNAIWNLPVPNYVSFIATIQNLTPFLVPSNWANAKEASIRERIEETVLTIVQANLASSLEQIFYIYEKDSKILFLHDQIQALLKRFLKRTGLKPNWVELTKKWIANIQVSQSGVERALKEDRYAIAFSMGNRNPEAITDVRIGQEWVPIEEAEPIDGRTLGGWVTQRSFEIKQLDSLVKIAKMKQITLYFEWLNPAISERSSLGFSLIGEQRIGKSTLKELKIKKEQLKSTLYRSIYFLALDYNATLEVDRKINKPLPLSLILPELSAKLEEAVKMKKMDPEEIPSWIQTTLGETIQYETNLAAFRCARAKKDRFMLSGYYEKLLPKLQSLASD